jgi:hypothetical protein
MTSNILFIGGSLNQTTMMHKVAQQLQLQADARHAPLQCYFSPFYADDAVNLLRRLGWLDATILGGRHRKATLAYFATHQLPVDEGGIRREYDLVVTCTDLIIQKNIRGKRLLLVQEGMTDPEGIRYRLVRHLRLPRFLANTAATGLSDEYDVFCVASAGYRDLFLRKGVRAEKIVVTGIPNFDHVSEYRNNDFPHFGYVLAATSSIRESFGWEDRPAFIRKARRVAGGRPLIFKLHPAEDMKRACREIQTYAPEALIYTDGNIHSMIANCEALVTQYSSVVYTALALEKEVHAAIDVNLLRSLTPVQNQGNSARQIAHIGRRLLETPLNRLKNARERSFSWERELRWM